MKSIILAIRMINEKFEINILRNLDKVESYNNSILYIFDIATGQKKYIEATFNNNDKSFKIINHQKDDFEKIVWEAMLTDTLGTQYYIDMVRIEDEVKLSATAIDYDGFSHLFIVIKN